MSKPYEFSLEDFPEYEVISVRVKDSINAMGKHIGTLYAMMRARGLEPAGPMFSIYYEKPVNPDSVDYELFMPVAGEGKALDDLVDFGGDKCLKLRLKGSYAGFGDAYAALEAEITRRGLVMSGPPREVYVRGPLFGFLTFIPIMITDIYFPVK